MEKVGIVLVEWPYFTVVIRKWRLFVFKELWLISANRKSRIWENLTRGPWATICSPDKCHATSSSVAIAIRRQIWPCHKKVQDHPNSISTNLVDFDSSWCTLRFRSFFVLEKKILSVLPYMGMAAMLFSGADPFGQFVNTLSTEGPMWNLAKIVQAISKKKTFKGFTILCMYMYRAQGVGQITPEILTVAKQFYYFNHAM